jgi:CRISPR/Cas system-associated protein Cas10 (large subunit of type III CRISPR-Cas system)
MADEKGNDIVHINITVRGRNAEKIRALMAMYNFDSYVELINFLISRYEKGGKAEGLKKILNKYENAKCKKCGRSVEIGETCFYDPTEHSILCSDCYIKANIKSANEELKLKLEIEKLKIQKKELEQDIKQYEKYKLVGNIIKELSEEIEKYQSIKEEFIKSLTNLKSFTSEDIKTEINKALAQISEISQNIEEKLDQLGHILKSKITSKAK